MSAADYMLQHRYGWRTGVSSTDTVGDTVAAEMFSGDVPFAPIVVDLNADPEYLAWKERLEAEGPQKLTPTEHAKGVALLAAETFTTNIKRLLPKVHSYDLRGGQDDAGNTYALVTLHTTDPYEVLPRAARYALKVAGASGVSVTTEPGDEPGQIVLMFSRGTVPDDEYGFDPGDLEDYYDEDDLDTGGLDIDSGDIPDLGEDPFATVQEGMRGEVDYLANTVNDQVDHVAKVLGMVLAGAVAAGVATAIGISAMLSGSKRFVKRIESKIRRLEAKLARAKRSKRVERLSRKVTILKGRIDSLKNDIDRTEALAEAQEVATAVEPAVEEMEW